MTARYSLVGSAALILSLFSIPAHAGWGPDGATIKLTTSNIPKVAAASDGGFGSIVAWQEESSPGVGLLRAQHVLPTGDVDLAWPSGGVQLSGVATARAAIGVVADRLGGAYVWWKQNASLYLTRVDASGAVAAGWPANGRLLGSTWLSTALPSVIEDGANGVYAGWVAFNSLDDPSQVLAVHLGPGNTGAGGWTNGIRSLSGTDPAPTPEYWPQLALAPDGGVFAAWAAHSLDEETVPSAYRLRRLTSAGLNASGWPAEGIDLGDFQGEWLDDSNPETGLVGLSDDGLGGVFAMVAFLTENEGSPPWLESRVFRLDGDGSPAADWPVAGMVATGGGGAYGDVGVDGSHRVLADGLGGALVGQITNLMHVVNYGFAATFPNGVWKPSSSAGGLPSLEVVRNGNGGVFYASFYPRMAIAPYEPDAHLRVDQSLAPAGWQDFGEWHPDPGAWGTWYGDIALAESGDGGAVFFWSQVNERFGLFARRFNGAGQVTDVQPAPLDAGVLALSRLRFVAGDGIHAVLTLPPGEAADLELFDVSGRRLASLKLSGEAGVREAVIPGSRDLSAGLYFARLATARASVAGKAIVAR